MKCYVFMIFNANILIKNDKMCNFLKKLQYG